MQKKLKHCRYVVKQNLLQSLSFLVAERKLEYFEIPHQLYIQNYSTALPTCLLYRKWLFHHEIEQQVCQRSDLALRFCYHQAVQELNRGNLKASGDQMLELKRCQDQARFADYLELCQRSLEGYGEIVFPHCGCDARKEGRVVPRLGAEAFRLQAAKSDGTPEVSKRDIVTALL